MGQMETIREFLIESNENLDRFDQELGSLESDPLNRDILASVFRTIHTIKGASGFLAFTQLEKLAHTGENLLASLRDGRLEVTTGIASALLAMADEIRQMLAEIEKSGKESKRDHGELISMLACLADGELPSQAHNIGEILVEKGVTTRREVRKAIEQQSAGDPRHLGEILVEKGAVKPQDVVEALHTQQQARRQSANESTIRVEVEQLDKLMDCVGQLALLRDEIVHRMRLFKDGEMLASAQRLSLLTTELQQNVMKTRTQPIGNLWAKFPGTVRDLAVKCGKQVRVEMEGQETELDRTVLEAIKDPLRHLVRNAVGHGIEAKEMRLSAGKDPIGLLSLRAVREGGNVNIEVSDDGNGLDLERIRCKAIEKALVTTEQCVRMSECEISKFVFIPGFSTARNVTNISGRGVGMDVVKTNLEKIGGTVEVHSIAGKGCTVRMKIPLAPAIRRNLESIQENTGIGRSSAAIKPANDLSNPGDHMANSTKGALNCTQAAQAQRMCVNPRGSMAPPVTRIEPGMKIAGDAHWRPRRNEVSCRLSGC